MWKTKPSGKKYKCGILLKLFSDSNIIWPLHGFYLWIWTSKMAGTLQQTGSSYRTLLCLLLARIKWVLSVSQVFVSFFCLFCLQNRLKVVCVKVYLHFSPKCFVWNNLSAWQYIFLFLFFAMQSHRISKDLFIWCQINPRQIIISLFFSFSSLSSLVLPFGVNLLFLFIWLFVLSTEYSSTFNCKPFPVVASSPCSFKQTSLYTAVRSLDNTILIVFISF